MTNKSLSLTQIQQYFIGELIGNKNETFRSQIKGNCNNNKVEQLLAIYRNNHRGTRLSALANIYAITLKIIGKENFDAITLKYINKNASTHWDLNTNGDDFYLFLQKIINSTKELEALFYLPELARLEYSIHLCYYADNNIQQEIKDQSPQHLYFLKDPSLFLFKSYLPVYQIWKNNKNEQGELSVENNIIEYFHIIYRKHYKATIEDIDELLFTLLNDAINGHSLFDLVTKHGENVLNNLPLFIERKWLSVTNKT